MFPKTNIMLEADILLKTYVEVKIPFRLNGPIFLPWHVSHLNFCCREEEHTWCFSIPPGNPNPLSCALQTQWTLLESLDIGVVSNYYGVDTVMHLYLCCKARFSNWDTWARLCWLPNSSLVAARVHLHTLLGCTALLRFSIHLSLSAAERQEKHLLPVEVVTYRRGTNRRKTNASMITLHARNKTVKAFYGKPS